MTSSKQNSRRRGGIIGGVVALGIGAVKIGAVAIAALGIGAATSSHDVHSFADKLRDKPGITSVVELKGADKPIGVDTAYTVNGGAAELDFTKSLGKLEVEYSVTSSAALDGVDYESEIKAVADDEGFNDE